MDYISRIRAIAVRAEVGFNRPQLKELICQLESKGIIPGVPEHVDISEIPLAQIIMIEDALTDLLTFYNKQNLIK